MVGCSWLEEGEVLRTRLNLAITWSGSKKYQANRSICSCSLSLFKLVAYNKNLNSRANMLRAANLMRSQFCAQPTSREH